MKKTSALLVIICFLSLLGGCRQYKRLVEKPVYIHDTLTHNTFLHDSVFLHDSTFVLLKSDTVYIDRTHTEYRYKLIHDTTSVIKEIPVEVTATEIKEVEKPLKWYQSGFIYLGIIAFLAGLCYIAYQLFNKMKLL